MDSKWADKPKYLTYKDLKKDCGKGFYHWMRPYGRFEPIDKKPDNVIPPRQPKAFIIRSVIIISLHEDAISYPITDRRLQAAAFGRSDMKRKV